MSHSPALDSPVMKLIPDNIDGLIILDVAHGHGNWGYQIRTKKKGNPILIGLDIWVPHVEKVNQINIYDELILCDARNPPLRSKSIDIEIACEVLEHISLDKADSFLNGLEALYKNILIVSTPLGFLDQGIVYENPHEQHLSGWHEKELQDKNYETKTVRIFQFHKPRSVLYFLRGCVMKWLFGIKFSTRLIIAWKRLE